VDRGDFGTKALKRTQRNQRNLRLCIKSPDLLLINNDRDLETIAQVQSH
jgi:hypothetical protein